MTAMREAPAARVPEPRPAYATGRVVGVRGRLILGATDVLAEDLLRLEPALKWRMAPRRPAHR
jgi:hypothetical protein